MQEYLYKNVNENLFSFTFLFKFSWVFMNGNWCNILYPWSLINKKLKSISFSLNQVIPNLMVQMLFSQFEQTPDPDFRKVGKSL